MITTAPQQSTVLVCKVHLPPNHPPNQLSAIRQQTQVQQEWHNHHGPCDTFVTRNHSLFCLTTAKLFNDHLVIHLPKPIQSLEYLTDVRRCRFDKPSSRLPPSWFPYPTYLYLDFHLLSRRWRLHKGGSKMFKLLFQAGMNIWNQSLQNMHVIWVKKS